MARKGCQVIRNKLLDLYKADDCPPFFLCLSMVYALVVAVLYDFEKTNRRGLFWGRLVPIMNDYLSSLLVVFMRSFASVCSWAG